MVSIIEITSEEDLDFLVRKLQMIETCKECDAVDFYRKHLLNQDISGLSESQQNIHAYLLESLRWVR
jgi:hypothetical protein